MGDNKSFAGRIRKKFKHPIGEYGATNFMDKGFYPSRNGNIDHAWNEGCNMNYFGSEGFTDYADFPAIKYYLNKYDVYPSSVQYDCILNYANFVKKIAAFKKDGFYCESLKPWSSPPYSTNVEIRRDFICFENEKSKVIVYITINSIIGHTDEKAFTIVGVFNPNNNPEDVLSTIKDKIIGLPLLTLKEETGFLHVLVSEQNGFSLEAKKIDTPDIDFAINYNADFEPIHKLIVEKLSIEKSKGLVLLHGKHGTGKTTYIRYLISALKKRVIFIPPNMTNAISDPGLIKFFLEYPNSVLVVEDAENVLMKRVANASQAIANILNLTDGLLSDCLNMQIIATFNTDVSNIDEALLRKGRLIAKYEFKELEASRSKLLSEKLGVNISGKHTLADIYNAEEQSFTKKNNAIGFKTAAA